MIVLFNKPFGVLCQFRDKDGRSTLADYIQTPNIYPAGRLDHDSEGLLILTDDGALAHKLTDPKHKQAKTYLAQVEGNASEAQLAALRAGVKLNDGITLPAQARIVELDTPWLWPRVPPIRVRKSIPDCWIELTIHEGRNRQVRRMTAAVGLPTLRLIRTRVAEFELSDLQPGQSQQIG